MKKILLTAALLLVAPPAFAKDYTIQEVTDESAKKQDFFSPDHLTIQPGDTVIFENAQDEEHEVMFISQPKQVDQMIMSPMHDKKGDKFSYRFTVPGTYTFHCHPHEKRGMEGTLIVGEPSKAGETRRMDHHKLANKLEHGDSTMQHDSAGISATGTVVRVDAEEHTIKLKHDPIPALGWPAMTMLFTAESRVDLSSVKAGDSVSFTLKATGKDDHIIASLKKN